MNQEKLNKILIDWKSKRINSEEAMQRVHRLNNLNSVKNVGGKCKK